MTKPAAAKGGPPQGVACRLGGHVTKRRMYFVPRQVDDGRPSEAWVVELCPRNLCCSLQTNNLSSTSPSTKLSIITQDEHDILSRWRHRRPGHCGSLYVQAGPSPRVYRRVLANRVPDMLFTGSGEAFNVRRCNSPALPPKSKSTII